ncbi:MAG: hypothetical protein IKJ59_06265 [Clostridia bacterium]|nr:hypothetical protein [Clostridia bacterium]
MNEKEHKRKFALWINDSSIDVVSELYEDDNCTSRSEFIEKAIHFYAGYVTTQKKDDYLPRIVASTVKGIIAESDEKRNRLLYKMAVEIAIMQNVLASLQEYDKSEMDRLRGQCEMEVKRLNGTLTFEDAVKWQS